MSGDGITVRVYNYCASKYWYRLGRLILPYNRHAEDEKNCVFCIYLFTHKRKDYTQPSGYLQYEVGGNYS